ncbi:aspartate/glutamate racemase family protein [Psychrobacter lutiphocae]|uniref:aspartate/glutamate racemase family protein n=1 Tax=Psychrobacter lutiphocae TaxID=540500 RepID=UPI00038103BA|nr:aspartate/glutamate racemase family protein [Psychrobacter lutiphocae]
MRTQKTLGIIGGMSWESTQTYYQLINKGVKDELGGLHSADIIIHSLDFAPIAALQAKDDWNKLAKLLIDSGLGLKRAGVEGLLIASNTMHKVAEQVQLAVDLPLIHIADATANIILNQKLKTVALLGTKFTMNNESAEPHFYQQRLIDAGLTVLVPESKAQDKIHDIIYNELCQGQLLSESRDYYIEVIKELAQQGAQGVILGCTEIGLLIKPEDSPIPVFDTTQIHAEAGVRFLLHT